jgi:hypothetical protein
MLGHGTGYTLTLALSSWERGQFIVRSLRVLNPPLGVPLGPGEAGPRGG